MSLLKNKKARLAKLLSRAGLFSVTRRLISSELVILNYHRVAANNTSGQYPFDDDLFNVSEDGLRRQMLWLRENSDPLSESDLLECLAGRRPPSRPVAVTFDDGYADNFTRALPVLRECGIPAIFFIPTEAVEKRQLGWWEIIAWVLKMTDRPAIDFQGEAYDLLSCRESSIRRLQTRYKLTDAARTKGWLEELASCCGTGLPSPESQSRELMSWEQIVGLTRAGMDVGSHTHSHRVLATLGLAEQRSELTLSKQILEARLGRRMRTLSYPVGGYEHFHQETMTAAREAGYEAAFSFCTGANRLDRLQRYDLRRIGAPSSLSLASAAVSLPSLFARRDCSLSVPRSAPQ